jgi:shikimate kinase
MTYAIVGHRGVGKSSLMSRLKFYFQAEYKYIDIDREIEAQHGLIRDIFEQKGEAYFRNIEADVFKAMYKLYGQVPSIFIFGSGFPIEMIPAEMKVIWVRRKTDEEGRIFLDRPRLKKELSALDEYKTKHSERQPLFARRADFVYHLPEGLIYPSQHEKKVLILFGLSKENKITLDKSFYLQFSEEKLSVKIEPFLRQLNGHLEFRSDKWNLKNLFLFLSKDPNWIYERNSLAPQSGNLLSLRDNQFFEMSLEDQKKLLSYFEWVDVDFQFYEKLTLNEALSSVKVCISSHEKSSTEAIQKLTSCDRKKYHFKLCPEVESFAELLKGYLWWKNDPLNRSFLPRSSTGRWLWFRQWSAHQQKMNFVSFLEEDVLDQPSLIQILSLPAPGAKRFAAVLGHPVGHSQSPQMHFLFFMKHNIPFFNIDLNEAEFEESIQILTQMGLRFAAITSPLKRKVYRWTSEKSADSHTVQAVNTLTYNESTQAWRGDQTDWSGLKNSLAEVFTSEDKKVIVWGGGGVLELLKQIWPTADYYPARTTAAEIKPGSSKPQFLVWASPRTPDVQWPPSDWRPRLVFDLNYAENSMGLEYAAKENLKYESGQRFFQEQALEQQKIWISFL